MSRFVSLICALLMLLVSAAEARAALNVVATTPDLAAITKSVAGEKVRVIALALHTQDPHWVDARPHLALDLARADLLVLNGAELEVGWLPTLLAGSRNGSIQRGARGHLDASTLVTLLEVPRGKLDRSMGDIHPSGNPHYTRDPRAVERIAVGIAKRLAELDPANKPAYLDRAKRFLTELRQARTAWEKRLASQRGAPIVAYHRSLVYFADWLGLRIVDHIEPRPGIPPNPRHIAQVIAVARAERVRLILQEAWFPDNTTKLVAAKCGAKLLQIPGAPDFAKGESYVAWMNGIVQRLAEGT
jgi:zinc/manganese transport system substrate-binding protein